MRPTFIHTFIHSGYFYSASSSPLVLSGAPDYSTDTGSEIHAEAPQVTASEGLAQGPYVAARAGFEPMTLETKGDESTNEPPRPTLKYRKRMQYALRILKIHLLQRCVSWTFSSHECCQKVSAENDFLLFTLLLVVTCLVSKEICGTTRK